MIAYQIHTNYQKRVIRYLFPKWSEFIAKTNYIIFEKSLIRLYFYIVFLIREMFKPRGNNI